MTQREQQDGYRQKMQHPEPDHLLPHEQVKEQGHARRHQRQKSAAFPIVVGKAAGDAADEDEEPGEKGLRGVEKLKKPDSPAELEQIADHIKGVEKDHENQIKTPHLVQKIDAAARPGKRGSSRRGHGQASFGTNSRRMLVYHDPAEISTGNALTEKERHTIMILNPDETGEAR